MTKWKEEVKKNLETLKKQKSNGYRGIDNSQRIKELNDPNYKSIKEMPSTIKNPQEIKEKPKIINEQPIEKKGFFGPETQKNVDRFKERIEETKGFLKGEPLSEESKRELKVLGSTALGEVGGYALQGGFKAAGAIDEGIDAVKSVGGVDDLLKGKAGRKILQKIDDAQATKMLQRGFKIGSKQAEEIFGMVKDLDKTGLEKLFSNKIVKWGAIGLSGTILWKLIDTSSMMSWAAIDNLIGAGSFFAKNKADAVIFQKGNATEALEDIDEALEKMEFGKQVLNETTRKNPFLKPYRDLLMDSADIAFMNMNFQKERINNTIKGGVK